MLWRVTLERKREGREKRDRSVALAVGAEDLEAAIAGAKAFVGERCQESASWRATAAVPIEAAALIISGAGDLDEAPAGGVPE